MFDFEADLLKSLGKGEEEAFKYVFDKYYESLCLYAENFTKDSQSAEEIVQDIFVNIWLNSKTSPILTSVKSYLYRSVHNKCLTHLGQKKAERKVMENLHYMFEDRELLHPVSHNYPISNLITQELEEKARLAIDALPEQCKKIYLLSRNENLSYPEIAKQLSITVGTVKTQMSRAFSRLREELKDYIPLILLIMEVKNRIQ